MNPSALSSCARLLVVVSAALLGACAGADTGPSASASSGASGSTARDGGRFRPLSTQGGPDGQSGQPAA